MRDVVLPAAVLGADGVEFVVVGSVALMLRGADLVPSDLDVVPASAPANLQRLFSSTARLATRQRELPTVHRMGILETVRVATGWGPVDLLLQRGREEFGDLREHATAVVVAGVAVMVASLEDVLRLRRRFKGAA